MAITTTVVTTTTTGVLAVSPTVDAQKVWLENLEPFGEAGEYARAGYQYLIDQVVSIGAGLSVNFAFTAGTTGAQFDSWNFVSTSDNVLGQLFEGATIVTSGTTIPAYNLNRNFPDSYTSTSVSASSITGGTAIIQEMITASKSSSGGVASSKVVTLEPNTQYGFKFTNLGNQTTSLHVQVGFVEFYNGYNDVWINGLENQTIRLKGREKVQLQLEQGEGIWASSIRNGVKVAVMRQD